MKLATLRVGDGTRAVRLDGATLVDLGYADLGLLLAEEDWQSVAARVPADGAAAYPVEGADFAPVVPAPSKVVCVGHNYRNHIKELGRELPAYPTLFPKFADTLCGAHDVIEKPAGVGHARDPKVYLVGGETVETTVEGIGSCVNTIAKA